MSSGIKDTIIDSPWVSVAALSLFGVPLSSWIVILGFLYGVVRLGMTLQEWYWKNKDRANGSNIKQDGGASREASRAPTQDS